MGVVVTFNPELDRLDAQFTAIAREEVDLVVVDNGSHQRDAVADFAGRFGFEIIQLPKNIGIAAAQNLGIERVRS